MEGKGEEADQRAAEDEPRGVDLEAQQDEQREHSQPDRERIDQRDARQADRYTDNESQ